MFYKLANEALQALETKTRANGNSYRCFKDFSGDWLTDLARHAHNGVLPDDFKYEFISDALQALVDHNDVTDAFEAIECDIYTFGLTQWLGSRNDRYAYVDQAVSEFGHAESVIGDIQLGQLLEKQEVFHLVVEFLEDRACELEETG